MIVQPLLTFINGEAEATLRVADRGLSFGDGLFETLLLVASKPRFLSLHIDRLVAGLAALQIPLTRGDAELRIAQLVEQAATQHLRDGIVKIIVTRGEGRGYTPRSDAVPTVVANLFPSPAANHYSRDGVTITVCRQRLSYQPALLGIKHLNRLDNVLAALEVQDQNRIEGLVLDDRDRVAEAVSRNVFTVKNGKLLTPDLHRGGVTGVMRRVIKEQLAPALALDCHETAMELEAVLTADEVFLCNSITGIWPVIGIDDTTFSIGPLTRKLQQALQQLRGAE